MNCDGSGCNIPQSFLYRRERCVLELCRGCLDQRNGDHDTDQAASSNGSRVNELPLGSPLDFCSPALVCSD